MISCRVLLQIFCGGKKSPLPLLCSKEGHNCHVWPCHVRAYKDVIIRHCIQCFEGTGWCMSLGNNVSPAEACVSARSFPWGRLYGRRYALVFFVPHSEGTHGEAPYCCCCKKKRWSTNGIRFQLEDWGQCGRGANPSEKGGGELCRSDRVEPSHCNSAYIIQACWWEKGGGARDRPAGFNNRRRLKETREQFESGGHIFWGSKRMAGKGQKKNRCAENSEGCRRV